MVVILLLVNESTAGLNIHGIVVDASGEPIIGASVLVVGTSEGTITDVDGHFNLSVSKNASLKISFIGYEIQ